MFEQVQIALDQMPATTTVYRQDVAEGEAAEPNGPTRANRLRNQFLASEHGHHGDFLLFADDDNMYVPGFAEQVKDVVASDIHSPYFFRGYFEYNQETLWKVPEIAYANIDTMCAVLPITLLSHMESRWGEHQAGDYALFSHLIDEVDRYYMIDVVIFHYTKQNGGAR